MLPADQPDHTLNKQSIGLKVIAGHGSMIDTTRPEGRMLFGMLAVLAEFERELISERTKADIKAARKRGADGRPPKLNPRQITIAKKKIASGHPRVQVARRLDVSVGTPWGGGLQVSASENHRQIWNGIKAIRRKRAAGVCP